jgi:phosphoribosylamine--glycine ligase
LAAEKIDYKGFIFIGVIKVGEDPYVIEYNCRMGDPETEVVMPRLKNDLVELFTAVAEQRLNDSDHQTDQRTACTIVAVSGGYPGSYEKGLPITGLDQPLTGDSLIFHAGTRAENDTSSPTAAGSSASPPLRRPCMKRSTNPGMSWKRSIMTASITAGISATSSYKHT